MRGGQPVEGVRRVSDRNCESGVRLTLVLGHHEKRAHLPVIELKRAG